MNGMNWDALEHVTSCTSSSFIKSSQLAAAQRKRKEKARVAARARRSQEASVIMEMANELHITQERMRQIDKATIIRLAIDYIKAFGILCNRIGFSNEPPPPTTTSQPTDQQEDDELALPSHLAPKLITTSIFVPKTIDNMNSHYLMIEDDGNGKSSFTFRPDSEISEADDLTHLAPQAGDMSILLEAEPAEPLKFG